MSYIGNTSTTQAFTPAVDYFSGNASTTAFTLSRPVASVAQVQVVVNNVAQNPSSAYTISSNTITFTSAPSSGTNNIYVYYTSPITQVIAPGQGTVTATSMASSTGTGAGVFQTSPTITTPTIDTITSAASTALTLKSAGTTAVTIDTSQNVGIGTTPSYKVDVNKGSSGSVARFGYSGGTYGYIYADTQQAYFSSDSSANNSWSCNNSTNYLVTYTNGSERMRIDSSGNVIIGATSAILGTSPLQTKSTVAGNQVWTCWNSATSGTRYYAYFGVGTSFTNTGAITSDGSTTSYVTTSDYRLKENIAPMTGALAKVAQLKPVTYTWKSTGQNGEGFIAHELQAVVPDAVTGEKDAVDENGGIKPQGIDTSFLVATLTAAIQELKAINDTQAETINALTARIEALENK